MAAEVCWKRRVDAAVAWIDEPRERLEVGRVQLVELAPAEQGVDDRVGVAQLLEHAGVGRQLALGRLLARLQAELVVQDLPKLGRRVQVELLAGLRVDLGLQRGHAVADRLAHLLEVRDVERDPAGLHPGEHRGERELDVLEEPAEPLGVDLLLHHGGEQRDGGRLGGGGAPGRLPEQLPLGLVLDRAQHVGAQVRLAEAPERVVGRRGIEQVAGEHRVERHARHVDPLGRGGPLERLRVVGPLRRGRVGQEPGDGLDRGQRGEGGLRPARRDRDPAGAVLLDEQPDALRRAGREDRRELVRGDLPQVELGHVDLGLGRVADVLQAVEEAPELERGEQPADLVDVPLAHHAVVGRHRELDVGHDPGELLVQGEPVHRRGEVLLELALQLVDAGHELLDRAELVHQLGGRLVPHARHARDVVAGVALQGHEVEVLAGRDPEPLGHGGLVVADDVADPLAVEHHGDPGPHELEEVPVGRDDRGVDPLCRRGHGEGPDRVVGLVAVGDPEHRDPQGLEHLLDQAELRLEVARRLGPARLVVGVLLEPHRRRARVERHGDQVGSLLGEQLDHHRGEAVDRVRDRARARGEGRRQGEERPVREGVPVEQEEAAWGLGGRRRGHEPYRSRRP